MWLLWTACVGQQTPEMAVREPLAPLEGARATPLLRINEVMADNASAVAIDGALTDWIEIVNLDRVSVSLSRVWLTDESGERWQGTSGETIAPGGIVLVVADDGNSPGGAPFAVSHAHDSLRLWVDGNIVDEVTIDELAEDVALARHPDGGPWNPTITVTPGHPNPSAPSASTDPSSVFFEPFVVQAFTLEVNEADLAILDDKEGAGVAGTLTFDGITLAATIRLKGSGSYRGLDSKPSFKVDLNELVPGQRLRGLKALTLNNGAHDPTLTHEWLTYTLFKEAGIPAPRVGFAQVTLNGTDYGLHTNIETWDDLLLARHYADPTGMLLEGTRWGDLGEGYENLQLDRGEWDEALLAELAQVLMDPTAPHAEQRFAALVDAPQFARYAAVEAVSMHWDGYQKPKNYQLYLAPNGLLQWLPHGTDWTWIQWHPLSYGSGDVFEFCLSHRRCAAAYYDEVVDIATLAETLDLSGRFEELWAWLEPLAAADSSDLHEPTHRLSHVTLTREHLQTRPAWARQTALETRP